MTTCSSSAGSIPTRARRRPSRWPAEPTARLTIAGIVQDERYFAEEIAPHIDGDSVRFLGPVDAIDRSRVLGGAHALLHLIDFDEPFGYSVVEALACGTPVVAYDRGSMTELIDHATTGFVVAGADEAVEAVALAGALDRHTIRASTAERFGAETMVDKYVAVYRGVLEQRT